MAQLILVSNFYFGNAYARNATNQVYTLTRNNNIDVEFT